MIARISTLCALAASLALPAAAAPKPKPVAKPASKPAAAQPAPAPLPAVASLAIAPKEAVLSGPRAVQHFIVTATLKDGSTLDVTDRAAFRVTAPKVAKIGAGIATPVGDGETKVVATVGGVTSPEATLTVEAAGAPAQLSFVNDVMPIMSKQGCNSSICHGSPAGKGGMKLSLFGYEPDLDHEVIKDKEGRRVNLKAPEKSLLLAKVAMVTPHGGGLRIKKGSADYNTLLAWIKAGAPGMGELEARVRGVEAIPAEQLMPRPGTTQRLVVMANLSDGTTQDVTDQALFSSNDDAIADVSPAGVVKAKRSGETVIMVRHLGQVAVARIAVLPTEKPTAWPALQGGNFIDDAVFAKLKKLQILPSNVASDEEFMRRAYLDTVGMVPPPGEARAFLANRDPKKREKLVDYLLNRPEFVDVWTLKWGDLLRNNPRLTRFGMAAYHNWIREQVAKNRPFDQFVRDILTSSGKNTDLVLDPNNLPPQLARRPGAAALIARLNQVPPNPATNYFLVSRDPLDLTSATSQIFMGVRIECARCHNHPFEKWTQNDYYGMAAFFAGVRRIGNGNQGPAVIAAAPMDLEEPGARKRPNRPGGTVIRHPKTNQPVEPKVLDETEVATEDVEDLRVPLAEWITSPKNPFFAQATANRVWAHYFGHGIVDPVDDFRATNPPSNPELLEALGKYLVEKKFDLKALMRAIMNSRTYQLSSKPNAYNRLDARNFSRAVPRRLSAEQLYDSISQACNAFQPLTPQRRGRPAQAQAGNLAQIALSAMDPDATRAHQIPTPRVPGEIGTFLDTFGRPRREVVCECERSNDGSMTQALVLINSDLVNEKIEFPSGLVRQLAESNMPDNVVVEQLYLAALTRRPTAAELADAVQLIRAGLPAAAAAPAPAPAAPQPARRFANGAPPQALAAPLPPNATPQQRRAAMQQQRQAAMQQQRAAMREQRMAAMQRGGAFRQRGATPASPRQAGIEDLMWGLLNTREFLFNH